ncbi:MAG TPA: hypothetical protein PKJ24_00690 [Prolixibacteraceae bacterium]|nr:hypothetical protein [Prolixibacteraceae bacterium]
MFDQYGWEYHDKLPDGFRLATMDDFHVGGKKKVGMQYLIKRATQEHYEVHHVKEYTRSQSLKPFLDHQMVFVKST